MTSIANPTAIPASWPAPVNITACGVYNVVRAHQYFEAYLRVPNVMHQFMHVAITAVNGKGFRAQN
jgi:hypothetical protein